MKLLSRITQDQKLTKVTLYIGEGCFYKYGKNTSSSFSRYEGKSKWNGTITVTDRDLLCYQNVEQKGGLNVICN